MKKYGLTKKYYNESNLLDNQTIGRIVSKEHEIFKAITEFGVIDAKFTSDFNYEAKDLLEFPVVGDFVIIETNQNKINSIIQKILKRKNTLIRKREWSSNYDHVVAANIDTIFVCLSLNNNFNIKKLEAYISIASKSTAEKVVVLTECYSFTNIEYILNEISFVTKGMEVIVTSGMDSDGYKSLKNYIKEGNTVVFIGPEHDKVKTVTKLLGEIHFENDLLLLPRGGILINTPEMRELGIESSDITKKFANIR